MSRLSRANAIAIAFIDYITMILFCIPYKINNCRWNGKREYWIYNRTLDEIDGWILMLLLWRCPYMFDGILYFSGKQQKFNKLNDFLIGRWHSHPSIQHDVTIKSYGSFRHGKKRKQFLLKAMNSEIGNEQLSSILFRKSYDKLSVLVTIFHNLWLNYYSES